MVTQTLNHWADGVTPESTMADVIRLRTEKYPDVGPHSVTGPIAVRGAHPGQMLRVDIIELVPRSHGFNLNYPSEFGTGLLPDDFPDGRLQHLHLDLETLTTRFGGATLPLRPFLGIMAVSPQDPGPHSTVPPGPHGGNIDLAELVEGTTLYLPIWNEGANFSVGDAHARQGDGEVCLTAIETAMDVVTLRLSVVDSPYQTMPIAQTPDHWITMGFNEDLLEATKQAARSMISLLEAQFGVDRSEAYGLCSMAVDFAVTQVVNKVRGVHAKLPKSIFA